MNELEKIKKEKIEKMMKKILEIDVSDENFQEEVIERSKKIPVVVDYWAPWCGPCMVLAPILEKLVKEYDGKFILAKINVDENPIVSQKYGIMSIPNVKMFKNGMVVDEFIGAIPERMVREWLEKSL